MLIWVTGTATSRTSRLLNKNLMAIFQLVFRMKVPFALYAGLKGTALVRTSVGTVPASLLPPPFELRGRSGFTLIELLVVLLVVALVTTLAGLSVGSGQENYRLRAMAKHLALSAELALEEAQLSGYDSGLRFSQHLNKKGEEYFQYQWLISTAEGWKTMEDDVFLPGKVPPGYELLVELEELPLQLSRQTEVAAENNRNHLKPNVKFFSSGEVTPAEVRLVENSSGEELWQIQWNMFGEWELRSGTDAL